MKFSGRTAILALITLSANAAAATIKRQNGPVDPSTDPDCTYYDTAYDNSNDCSYFEEWWGLSHAEFVAWNPSVKDDCSGILVDNFYCVEVTRKPTPTTSSSTTTSGPTGSPKPSPTQDGLIESCTNFYKSVKADTCDKVVGLYGTFTKAQFIEWNLAVGDDCSGIWADTYYCVGIPGTPTTRPTVTPTGTPKPSPTQEGLIKSCTAFYKAVKTDTCDKIVNLYGTFTKAQFIQWNPAVESDCSGIWADTYYCVSIPGTPTTRPATTTTTATGTPKPSPTQPGLIGSCTTFYKAVKADTCDKIVDKYGTFTKAQFIQWNPAVESDCYGIWADTYYCVGIPGTPTTRPATTTTMTTTATGTPKPSPTQEGVIESCQRFYKAVKEDTCDKIINKYGTFTKAQFIKWNPAVGNDCTSLWAETYYCIGIPGTPTTTTKQSTTTTTTTKTTTKATTTTGNGIATPTPTQSGMVSNCDAFHFVKKGESCQSISDANGISLAQFMTWNPKVGNTCSGLWLDAYVCVSIIGHTPSKTTTTTTTTKATSTCATAHPTPTQPGSICACKTWYKPATNEYCADIEKKYSITAAQFNKWNPQVGSDCKGLYAGYNVCVKA